MSFGPSFSPLLDQLIQAFRCLPGVGPKSAQRLAFHVLSRDKTGALHLAGLLQEAIASIQQCRRCRILCEEVLCQFCRSTTRSNAQLCIVEGPVDVLAIEQSGQYRGLYFVLSGRLSPIDGIGPREIGLELLRDRIKSESLAEVILALNPTVEGEATAHYIADMVRAHSAIQVSRIAYGVPLGGALEYVDGGTIAKAFSERALLKQHEEVI